MLGVSGVIGEVYLFCIARMIDLAPLSEIVINQVKLYFAPTLIIENRCLYVDVAINRLDQPKIVADQGSRNGSLISGQ